MTEDFKKPDDCKLMDCPEKPRNKTPLIYTTFNYDKRVKMRSELEKLFNRLSIDNEMNMPDFILAEMVDNFIMTIFNTNKAVNKFTNGDTEK